jgi:hypothetical protein
MTAIISNVQYSDLQRHLCQDYYDIGLNEGVWAPRLSKSDAKQDHTCRTDGFPRHTIEKRPKTIQSQLERTANELQQNAQQWQLSFDLKILSNVINELLRKSQQRLRQELDYKRSMLVLNSSDRHAIAQFYDLQSNIAQSVENDCWKYSFMYSLRCF